MKNGIVGNNDYKYSLEQFVDAIVPKPVKQIVRELRERGIEAECCKRKSFGSMR
ncbi:hypothetical protein [Bacillus sp. JCM 19034]|uniref:hypothetical protein n=1 Tax=Bacillus sp. JCM 19034 TaxID=1481928 RepID=UPI000A45F81A|nr:hypothetical protein [Bacillus sp. JCM 19034]